MVWILFGSLGGIVVKLGVNAYFNALGTDSLSAAVFVEVAVSALVLTVRNWICM